MHFIPELSIRTKLILLATASVSLGLVLACIGLAVNDINTIKFTKVEQLKSQARMLAFNSTGVLTFHDQEAARRLLSSICLESTIEFACLYDVNKQVLAWYSQSSDAPTLPPLEADLNRDPRIQSEHAISELFQEWHRLTESNHIEVFQPVIDRTDGDEVVGALYLRANMDDVYNYLLDYATIVGIVMVCSLIAAVALAAWLQQAISRPILKLAEIAENISSVGDYSIRIERESNDELGTLYTAFNRMLDHVETSERNLRLVQADLFHAKEAAEASDGAKSDFLANMSHEIRTPLTGILGFTELLLNRTEQSDWDKQQDYLQTIHQSGRHLLTLINDILDLSKIEAGRMEYDQIAFSVHQIIAEVISVLRPRAQKKELELDCYWESQIPATIFSDPARLRQLLINLVGNAIKFTNEGGVQIIAKVIDTEKPHKLMIRVVDSGMGIPNNKLGKIFDPFIQADNSVTRKFGGTGLGLAISRRIAVGLGGELTVDSEVGEGTTFTATILTGNLDGVEMLDPEAAEGMIGVSQRPEKEQIRLPSVRILLVEDGETNRELISLFLVEAGAQVTTAQNGKIGVELAKRHPFDLIIMDMQMPVMDGYTATLLLRQDGIRIPIIALTAHAMKGDKEKCKNAGCSGYLTKPIDSCELLLTVAKAIGRDPTADRNPFSKHGNATYANPARSLASHTDPEKLPLISKLPATNSVFVFIIQEFVERLQEKLNEMYQAWKERDFVEIARLAHWLKGTGGTAGFPAFTKPSIRLETAAKNGEYNQIEPILAELVALSRRIQVVSSPSELPLRKTPEDLAKMK